MNIQKNLDIEVISRELSLLDLSRKTVPNKLRYDPQEEKFWNQISNYFFKDERIAEFYSKELKSFPRRTLEQILSFKVNVTYQNLSCYIKKLNQTNIDLIKWKELNFTPFHIASVTARRDVLEGHSLLSINSVDKQGRTALQLCAFFGHLEMAKMLLSLGADHTLCAPIYGSGLAQAILGKNQKTIAFFKDLETAPRFQYIPTKYKLHFTSKIAEEALSLYYSKCYANPGRKQQFNRQINNSIHPELLRKYYAQEKIVRIFYHSWKIDWNQQVDNTLVRHKTIFNDQNHNLEFFPKGGGYSFFFLHKMAKSVVNFKTLFTDFYDHESLSILKETLDFASNQCWVPPQKILERIQIEKKPVILSVFLPGHTLSVVIIDRLFIICNGGYLGRKPVEIFYFDNKKLSLKIISELVSEFESERNYNEYFFTFLNKYLKFNQLHIESQLEMLVDMPWQKIGNCSWHNNEMSSSMLLLIFELKKLNLLDTKNFTAPKVKEQITTCKHMCHNLILFQQLEHLENYLKITTAPNREFISNNEMYPEITAIFQEKKQLQMTHPYLLKQMYALEKRYPILVSFRDFLRL